MEMTAPIRAEQTRSFFNRIALIDADFLKYHVTLDIAKYFEQEGDPEDEFGENYVDHFTQQRISSAFYERFEVPGMIFCFSGSTRDNYRYYCAMEKEYKGNRSAKAELPYENYYRDMSKVIAAARKIMPTLIFPWLEADDLVCALQNENTFIYSHDKDMQQVPGWHYDINRGSLKIITKKEAMNFLAFQMLTGDTTDNISGLPGIGPKKAAKLLEGIEPSKMLMKVKECYVERYGPIEGTDRYCESWNLLKMKEPRGDHFVSMIQSAFALRDAIIKTKIK